MTKKRHPPEELVQCHHGYSKKSCKECTGEKRIIKQEKSVMNAQAAVIVAALDWYEETKYWFWLKPDKKLRTAIKKLVAVQRKK